jgi:hypothetical protein
MEEKDLSTPGWYLARDSESKWWNLFVDVTKEPPYRCIKIINGEICYMNISPEMIKEVSHKRISLGEFKIIQELQKIDIAGNTNSCHSQEHP